MLCSDAKFTPEGTIGDPTETALLDKGLLSGLDKNFLEEKYKRVFEMPFDSERKLMSTVNTWNETFRVNTKGGLDELLACCCTVRQGDKELPLTPGIRETLLEQNLMMAGKALRVLAIGYKYTDNIPNRDQMWKSR